MRAVAAAAGDTIPRIAKNYSTTPCTNNNLKHLILLPMLSTSS
jgi:hypothetical protein